MSIYLIQLSKLFYIIILKPISICGNSRTRCETKQTTVPKQDLDKVTIQKNETPIRKSEATDEIQLSQQTLLDLQTKKGKLKQI